MIFDELFDALASLFEEFLAGIFVALVAVLNVGWRWFLRALYVFVALGGLYVLTTYVQLSSLGLLGVVVGALCLTGDLWLLWHGRI